VAVVVCDLHPGGGNISSTRAPNEKTRWRGGITLAKLTARTLSFAEGIQQRLSKLDFFEDCSALSSMA
jgi:hypothetical protein